MELSSVVPWGRSFDEYRAIFSLTDDDLGKCILGCSDGPASFNAELTRRGGNVVSVDPTYQFSAEQLKQRIAEVFDEIMSQTAQNRDLFVWDSFPSVAALGQTRMEAMNRFIADYETGKEDGRYLYAALPDLPFADKQFELALCAHYLFLYSEQVTMAEHIASINELARVADEVRIYPLVALNGELSPFVDQAASSLREVNLTATMVDVDYQFQKGATQMLVIVPA